MRWLGATGGVTSTPLLGFELSLSISSSRVRTAVDDSAIPCAAFVIHHFNSVLSPGDRRTR